MKTKLSDLASIAEVIGAIAIVVSLIYVGVQVDDSTRAVRSATANDTSAALSSWYSQMGNSQQGSEVFWRGMTKPESLTPEEMFQFIVNAHGIFWIYQSSFYLAQEGTLDEELGDSVINTMLGLRELPGFILYWEQRGCLFKADFRQAVDDMLASGTTNRDVESLYIPREPGQAN
jgi:hypothetical protein